MKKGQHGRNILIFWIVMIGLYLVPFSAFAQLADPVITNAIESQILVDPGVRLNDVEVKTTNGIVTLSGTVNNILARDRAVKVAQTVRGVRSVIDQIAVKPSLRLDSQIMKDIEDAFIYDPLTESWEMYVKVNSGKVTLSGTVDSWAERELAAKIAKGVRGVTALENNINVDYKTIRNDTEIRQEIDRRLLWDALVDHHLITVNVNDGNVTLNGTVGSAAERLQAHGDAWVAGVKSVEASGLEVKWWARNDKLRKNKYALRDDAKIKQAVNDAFLYDPRVSMFDILVYVDNGSVTLNGKVNSLRTKRAAARDARNTVGVWQVNNFIKVRPNTPTDKKIAANIRNAFVRDPYVERFEINVKVIDGNAYLNGTVDTYFEKAQADYIAAGIYGVKEVHNRVKVENTNVLTYNPYIDSWYTYDYDWYIYPNSIPVMSDWEIKRQINNEIFWSPFIDIEDVTVTVDNGIATLTGKVDSWVEYSIAVENALEGGAIMVDNELELKNRSNK